LRNFVRSHSLLAFFSLAYAFTWVFALPVTLSERGWVSWHAPEQLEWVAAFGPFAAAMFVARVRDGRAGTVALLAGFNRVDVHPNWMLFTVFSPFLLLMLAIAGLAITGAGPEFAPDGVARLATAAGLFDLVVVTGLIQGVGEEPGWRGFALPRLRERHGALKSTLLLFPVWLFWHLPFFLSRPEFGIAQFAGFGLGILSAAIWLTLIWDATQSLLLAVLWHAFVNIARGIALLLSMPVFLAMTTGVLLGAVIIVIYWLLKRPGPTGVPV